MHEKLDSAKEALGPLSDVGISKDGVSYNEYSLGKDGAAVEELEIANGWTTDIKLGKGKQSMKVAAPTELEFPPDGVDLNFAKVAIPLLPFAGLDVTAGATGGVKLENTSLNLSRDTVENDNEALERITLGGTGGIGASFGVKLEVALWGGVPILAAVRAGLRAQATAKVKLELKAGGKVDIRRTVPKKKGAKPVVLSKEGEFALEGVGEGKLNASLSAFVGFELFGFNGDLYELDLASADIGTMMAAGRMGAKYGGGKGKAERFREGGLEGGDWIKFDWLFAEAWKASKHDKARNAMRKADADLSALKNMRDLMAGEEDKQAFINMLIQNQTTLGVISGDMQLLLDREESLKTRIEGSKAELKALEENITGPLAEKNRKIRSERFIGTDWFRGDISELKEARKSAERTKKGIVRSENELQSLQPLKAYAGMHFLGALDPAHIDAAIAVAERHADEVHKKNWPLVQTESASIKIEAAKQRDKYREAIEAQWLKTEAISSKLAQARQALDHALQDPNPNDQHLRLQIYDLELQLKAQEFQGRILDARLRKVDTEEEAKMKSLLGLLGEKGMPVPDAESTDPTQKKIAEASEGGGGIDTSGWDIDDDEF